MMRKRGVIGRSNNEEIEENEQRHLIKRFITIIKKNTSETEEKFYVDNNSTYMFPSHNTYLFPSHETLISAIRDVNKHCVIVLSISRLLCLVSF